jgi:flagellar biosynthetic protein FliO
MYGLDAGEPATAGAGGSYGALALTSLLVLVVVAGGAWVALRLLARWLDTRRGAAGVQVVGRVPLEPRRSLYVVEASGRRLLLGVSESGIAVLTEMPAEQAAGLHHPAADCAPRATGRRWPRRSFAEMVAQALAHRAHWRLHGGDGKPGADETTREAS